MEDDEAVDSGGLGGPCGACEYHRRDCGLDCIFVPFFPPGSRADFARVRALFGEDTVTNVISMGPWPDLRQSFVKFMIVEAETRDDGSAHARITRNANATSLTTQIDNLLDCLFPMAITVAHILNDSHLPSAEMATPPTVTTSLQDVQEAVGGGGDIGDVRGDGDCEDRGDESVAPAAALNDDIRNGGGKVEDHEDRTDQDS